jgi:hypothetical protein
MFSLGETDDELAKPLYRWCTKEYIKQIFSKELTKGRCIRFRSGHVLIRLRSYPVNPSDHDALQHEIFHAVSLTLRNLGLLLSDDSEEAFAYLTGYVTRQVHKRLEKNKLKLYK